MARKFYADLQPLVAAQFFVEIAIGFFGLGVILETADLLFHSKIIGLEPCFSKTNQPAGLTNAAAFTFVHKE